MTRDNYDRHCTVEDILDQVGIKLVPGKNHFESEYRSCQSTGEFVVAVRAALAAMKRDFEKEMMANQKNYDEIIKAYSKTQAKFENAMTECSDVAKIAIKRGLELTDIPEVTRERIMSLKN